MTREKLYVLPKGIPLGAEWKARSVSKSLFALSLSSLAPSYGNRSCLGTSNLNTQVFLQSTAVFPSYFNCCVSFCPALFPFLRISSFHTSGLLMMPQSLLASSSWFYPLCVFAVLPCFFYWPSRTISTVTEGNAAQPRLTLCEPTDRSPPGSPVPGTLQARALECVAIPFSRGSSLPGDQTWGSHIAGRFFTIWATREAHLFSIHPLRF